MREAIGLLVVNDWCLKSTTHDIDWRILNQFLERLPKQTNPMSL